MWRGHSNAVSKEVTQLQATEPSLGSPESVFLPLCREVWLGDQQLRGQLGLLCALRHVLSEAACLQRLAFNSPACVPLGPPSNRPQPGWPATAERCAHSSGGRVRNRAGVGSAPSGGPGGGSFLPVPALGALGVPGLVAASLQPPPPLHMASALCLLLSLCVPLTRTLVTGLRAPR